MKICVHWRCASLRKQVLMREESALDALRHQSILEHDVGHKQPHLTITSCGVIVIHQESFRNPSELSGSITTQRSCQHNKHNKHNKPQKRKRPTATARWETTRSSSPSRRRRSSRTREAANAAGDPNAREEILAKAINKEIEAESFGKAAKYTQSGAFQGLAAGAGLGVQPGVTIGKITGAIVGGTVSTVTGLLGGGIGSVYGAMNGPMWNLGEMASHGVRGVVGDFPNWKSTPAQKKALEKMVMQSKETQAPSEEELEQMKNDMPDDMPQSWSQSVQDMTSWRPSVPSLPKMPNMPSMSQAGTAVGLGGLLQAERGGRRGRRSDRLAGGRALP